MRKEVSAKNLIPTAFLLLFISGFFVVFNKPVLASSTDGTADSAYKYAWGENIGWLNFGTTEGNVHITDSALTGYAWGENIGWLSLNCSNDSSCGTVDYKVANDGAGTLSGYAWSENTGWINFNPTYGGVTINSSGEFSGYAWGENIGWIVFNCATTDSCATIDYRVKTDWRPQSARGEENRNLEVYDVSYYSTDVMIVIDWKINRKADGHLRWGRDRNLEKEKNDNENQKKHRMTLRNLEPDTQYFFRVKSTDENGNSNSSRIYDVSTKSPSIAYVFNQWRMGGNDKENSNENYEEVKIDVRDKTEKEIREDVGNEIKDNVLIKIPEQNTSSITDLLSMIKNGITDALFTLRDGALYVQRETTGFFKVVREAWAQVYRVAVSKWDKEKVADIAKQNQKRLYPTFVFNSREKKRLSEVRFQILDKLDNPIPNLETALFSDPQTSITDNDGIVSFRDVAIGSHTLAFDYQGESFQKKVSIEDTLADEGKVMAEVVQIKSEKEKIALWMWGIIVLLAVNIFAAVYFARKYYKLRQAK